MTAKGLLALLVASAPLVSGGCDRELPPRGQIVLHVDTDAVVPLAEGTLPRSTRLAAMVDRALFEVLVDGAVLPGGTRAFAIDEAVLREGRLSIGVLPPPGLATAAVRVRLFRADRVAAAEPPPGVTLDTLVTLPAVAEEGVADVHVLLSTEDFGRRVGPRPAAAGKPAPRTRAYNDSQKTRCDGDPGPEEVCVPGGTYFFGNPAFRGRTESNDIYDERLVEVSPFFLDRTEVTVGAFRRVWPALAARGIEAPRAWSGSRAVVPDPTTEANWCTYGPPGAVVDGIALDELPLSCVSWTTARAYCQELGKDLPSEAEFEYVTSGLGEEWSFPWGEAEPRCSDAMWGRGGAGPFGFFDGSCREPGSPGWVAFPGTATADTLDSSVLGNGSPEKLVDLAGNLGEWMVDFWARQSDAAWRSLERSTDPRATTPSETDGELRVVRGGDWATAPLATRAGFRLRRPASDLSPRTGFRCRRPGKGG